MKFYERIKVFLSKKCENTSSSYHPMGTGRLMDVWWTFFFSRLDVQETSYKRPWDVSAHWARVFLIFSDKFFSGITKCVRLVGYKVWQQWITKCVRDYKVWQGGLQNASGITKCGGITKWVSTRITVISSRQSRVIWANVHCRLMKPLIFWDYTKIITRFILHFSKMFCFVCCVFNN